MKNNFFKMLFIFLIFLQNVSAQLVNDFRDNQLVVIGETNHASSHGVDLLIDYVKEVQKSKLNSVKYIFIEGIAEYKEMYERLSLNNVEDEILKSNDRRLLPLLCHPEWRYQIKKLFPVIRRINQERRINNLEPLIAIPIDSVKVGDVFKRNLDSKVEIKIEKECLKYDLNNFSASGYYLFMASYERELATSKIFLNYFKVLKPEDRALVFYHQGHIFKNVKACIPSKTTIDGTDIMSLTPRKANWLQIFRTEKNISIKTIAIDHEALSVPNDDELIYGVMGPSSKNFANGIYPILYTENDLKMFDSIVLLKNKKFTWYDIDGEPTPSQVNCSEVW
jgi:hypothetical protein